MSKPNKDITRIENYVLIYFMTIDIKILNKILENQNQQYIKRIIEHGQVGFIPRLHGWFSI